MLCSGGWSPAAVFTPFPPCSNQSIRGFTSCWEWTFQQGAPEEKPCEKMMQNPAQVAQPAQENVSEIISEEQLPQCSLCWCEAGTFGMLWSPTHHVQLLTPGPPDTSLSLAHRAAISCSLAHRGLLKTKLCSSEDFPPNPNKMTPKPLCLQQSSVLIQILVNVNAHL